MSKKQQGWAGCIPIKTPMLCRILKAARSTFAEMTKEEIEMLYEEIKAVTGENCSSDIYDIAKMLEHTVEWEMGVRRL